MKSFLCILLCIASGTLAQNPEISSVVRRIDIKRLENVKSILQKGNVGLGIVSRSLIIASLSKALRGEDNESVREDLIQAIITLTVVDIGGGVVYSGFIELAEIIATDNAFKSTQLAITNFGKSLVDLPYDLNSIRNEDVTGLLKLEKDNPLSTFARDVDNLDLDHPAKVHIKKARKWAKVKFGVQIIAPLFDLISIFVNARGLELAIRSCDTDCNEVAIASSVLGIASGVAGVLSGVATVIASGTAVAPVLGIFSAILGLLSTILELSQFELRSIFSPEQRAILKREKKMERLDVLSRSQLYSLHKILHANDVERYDLYIANQGHLPKWFDVPPAFNNLQFGKTPSARPRKKAPLVQKCETPHFGNSTGGFNLLVCPYLAEGRELQSKFYTGGKLGYSFYGFTYNAKNYLLRTSGNKPSFTYPLYVGSTIFIPTHEIQLERLTELGVQANLRGLDIDTGIKGNDDGAHDDLVAIGDMPSLDADATVKIRMGKGNDALNIDGRLGAFSRTNVLDADLGPYGHNSLSFQAIGSNSQITGVKYDASTGLVKFKFGENQQQILGHVQHVENLVASPFRDDITLYANKAGEKGIDFRVLKVNGLAMYRVKVSELAIQSHTRHFQINDNSQGENGCSGHVPVLALTNFFSDAKTNDILYKDGKIHIYGYRKERGKRQDVDNISQDYVVRKSSIHKRRKECPGEKGGNPSNGSIQKELLATIQFNTKCPGVIEARTASGECVMRQRRLLELDTRFFSGERLIVDFNQRKYQGTSLSDYAVLKCPSSTVNQETTIELRDNNNIPPHYLDLSNYLVIGSEMFLDPCNIDGDETNMKLERISDEGPTFLLLVESSTEGTKFNNAGGRIVLKGVDKIINEYGQVIFDLANYRNDITHNFYDIYSSKTAEVIVKIMGRPHSEEVKNNILTCILDKGSVSKEECEELFKGNSNG